jgi:hypothetical protein
MHKAALIEMSCDSDSYAPPKMKMEIAMAMAMALYPKRRSRTFDWPLSRIVVLGIARLSIWRFPPRLSHRTAFNGVM